MNSSNIATTLWDLIQKLFSQSEFDEIRLLLNGENIDLDALSRLDSAIGGPSKDNISSDRSGRYELSDEDIFRPLQYCDMYISRINDSTAEWLTRAIVHMSSLHIEGIIKRISGTPKHPLGRALRALKVKQTIEDTLLSQINVYLPIYNSSKHDMNHPRDTHLFSTEAAILSYLVCRKFAIKLLPHISTKTDLRIFNG